MIKIEVKIEDTDRKGFGVWATGKIFYLEDRDDKIERLHVIEEVKKYLEEEQ